MLGPMQGLPSRPALLLAALLALLPATAAGQGGDDSLVDLEVRGSPLAAGQGGRIATRVTLTRPADLRLRVVDFDGRTVRELFDGSRGEGTLNQGWFGSDADGARVPLGPYRIVATATAGGVTERADAWVTVADRPIYPRAPGWITVAVDPGHGGDYDGAVAADGTREADLNLDIGLRLARMLEGAGVAVVLTRTTDGHANEPPEDRTGDGVIDDDDELAARPDAANLARADLFLSIHNNVAVNPSVGGPSTFFYDERSFSARSARLARLVQDSILEGLTAAVGGGWAPFDHGTLVYPYYVLRGYDPPRLRRPTQMPAVLSEGLFLSNPRESALLRRRTIRAAVAAAYYEAIAEYLARRGAHVGYELMDGPAGPVLPGEEIRYRVEVRNQGSEPIRGWRLRVLAVDLPRGYVGPIRDAATVGERRIPSLGPGEAEALDVSVTAPGVAGERMLLFDARDRDGRRAAELGSPVLQVQLSVSEPVPTPSGVPVESDPSGT
jgi:N-acetylmuramoyl-L-alanine amidase